jgi:hypothetical protein
MYLPFTGTRVKVTPALRLKLELSGRSGLRGEGPELSGAPGAPGAALGELLRSDAGSGTRRATGWLESGGAAVQLAADAASAMKPRRVNCDEDERLLASEGGSMNRWYLSCEKMICARWGVTPCFSEIA